MLAEPATVARLLGPARIDPARQHIPLAGSAVALGFPSPAEDFLDDRIDLNEWLIHNPAATFYYRASGWSMLLDGICDGDLLVVDRSVTPVNGDLVLAIWDGNQPTCKRLKIAADHIELQSRNPHCQDIVLPPGTEVEVFAVTGVVRQIQRTRADVRPRRR